MLGGGVRWWWCLVLGGGGVKHIYTYRHFSRCLHMYVDT